MSLAEPRSMRFVPYGVAVGLVLAALLRPFGLVSGMAIVGATFAAWRFGTATVAARFSGRRLEFLDAARGVAATMVAIDHVLEVYAPDTFRALNGVIYWGNAGVLLFFLISGFIIPATLERDASPWAFPINRAFRILPLFYLAFVAAAIARTVVPGAQDDGLVAHPVRTVLLNLTLTHYFADVPGVLVLSWTLCVEAFFYLVAWLLRRAGLLVRTDALVLAGAGLLAVQGTRMTLTGERVGVYLLGWTLLFLVGTLTYRHATGAIRGRRVGVAIAAALILATLTLWDYGRRGGGRLVDSGATSVVVASAAFGVCYAMRDRAWPAALTWLGRVSFGLYLWHGVLLLVAPRGWPLPLAMGVIVGGSIAVAGLTYRFVEEPMVAIGRRIAARF